MSCIHYKFKTTLDYRSVSFDGVALSLGDLKKAIFQQKRMKPGEFDLEITNAQTKEVYKNADELIPKNSSVIVSRVPIQTSTKNSTSKSWEAFKQNCAKAMKEQEEKAAQEAACQAEEIAKANSTELEKIKAMMSQSTKEFDPSNYKGKVPTGQPPPGYKCYKCGQAGHYIQNCLVKTETNAIEPRYKRSTGIPNSYLTFTNDPTTPGALLTYSGQFAVPTIDKVAYQIGKKERPPFLPGEDNTPPPESKVIPQELLCLICKDLLRDAVLIPCCGNSFCDECIRNKLLETEDHECPSCHEQDVSPDRLIANKQMRRAIVNFHNETGYMQVKNRAIENLQEERRSASPTFPNSTVQQSQPKPQVVQQPVYQPTPQPTPVVQQAPAKPVSAREGWKLYNQQRRQQLTQSQPVRQSQPPPNQLVQPPAQPVQPVRQVPSSQPQPNALNPAVHRTQAPATQSHLAAQTVPQAVHQQAVTTHHPAGHPQQSIQARQPVTQAQHATVAHHPQAQIVPGKPVQPTVHQSSHPQIATTQHPHHPGSVPPAQVTSGQHLVAAQQQTAVHHPQVTPTHVTTTPVPQHVGSAHPSPYGAPTHPPHHSQPGAVPTVQAGNLPTPIDHSENSVGSEDRAPTPVKDEPHPGSALVGHVPENVQPVQALGGPRSSDWKGGNTIPPVIYSGGVPLGSGIPHPPILSGPPPGFPVPVVGAPNPAYPAPYGTTGAFPPFVPGLVPLSKEEFYREQKRIKDALKNKDKKNYDVMDHFTKDIFEKKAPKPRSRTRSKSPRRSSSPRRSRSPRYSPRRSRSPRLRSRSPYRSRSRTPPRYRSRSRSRFRSRSRYRSRSRSYGRYRSFSRSPVRSYRRCSRSKSRSPYRRYSPYRRSPGGPRRRSVTPPLSPGYRGRGRRYSPVPDGRYHSPGRFTPPPPSRYPPEYGYDGGPPPDEFYRFNGPPRISSGPRGPHPGPPGPRGPHPGVIGPQPYGNPRFIPPGVIPPLIPPPPPGYGPNPGGPPMVPSLSRSPVRSSRYRDSSPPGVRGRPGYPRYDRYDRNDRGDRRSDRSGPPDERYDRSKYPRDYRDGKEGYNQRDGQRDLNRNQERESSQDRNSQTSDSGKPRSSKEKRHRDKENKENSKDDLEKSKEGKIKKKKESKKKDKSEKKKRDKSKDKKKDGEATKDKDDKTESEKDGDTEGERSGKTPPSAGSNYVRSSGSTLIFLTGGGEETSAEGTDSKPQNIPISKASAEEPTLETKENQASVKKEKSEKSMKLDDANDMEPKPKKTKKKSNLVEYNETSGDMSEKSSKRKSSKKSKKDKAKGNDKKGSNSSPVTKKGKTDGAGKESTKTEETDTTDTETNVVNRAPPSPHDIVPSSPLYTTDGAHEDEPSPPGVNDKPDLLNQKSVEEEKAPELMYDLPELSKWERDDFVEEESDNERPVKSDVKKSLPKSVIEKAEKAITQKQPQPKVSSVATAITSPPDVGVSKKRRVYLEDEKIKESTKPPKQNHSNPFEDNRKVHTKQKSMQITISSKERQRLEDSERRGGGRKGDKSSSGQRDRIDSSESERKSVFSRIKFDDDEEKIKDDRQKERKPKEEENGSRKVRDLREKLPVRTDRREHERSDSHRSERDHRRHDREHSDRDRHHHRDEPYKHDERQVRRPSNSSESTEIRKSEKDSRKIERQDSKDKKSTEKEKLNEKDKSVARDNKSESRSKMEKSSNSESKSSKSEWKTNRPVIDRKESLLDESLFEPDYNEDLNLSESEMSQSSIAGRKDAEASQSGSSRDNSPSSSPKKRKRLDSSEDESSPSKKSKHKKHKHKHKANKHKHKKKKHKKTKDDEDE